MSVMAVTLYQDLLPLLELQSQGSISASYFPTPLFSGRQQTCLSLLLNYILDGNTNGKDNSWTTHAALAKFLTILRPQAKSTIMKKLRWTSNCFHLPIPNPLFQKPKVQCTHTIPWLLRAPHLRMILLSLFWKGIKFFI